MSQLFTGIGRLTRDVEMRSTAAGKKVANFGLAFNGRPYTNAAGEKVDNTTFFDCEAFGNTAEFIEKYFTKGKPLHVRIGEIKLDQWDDKETGQRRSKHVLKVLEAQFLPVNERAEPEDNDGEPKTKTRKSAKPKADAEPAAAGTDDSIPF